MESGSAPETVAETVYAAATDTTGRLRFAAGADAEQMLAARAASDDNAFYLNLFRQFGVASAH